MQLCRTLLDWLIAGLSERGDCKAIAQFVTQYRAGRSNGHSLDPTQDRLVLAVGPGCSNAISLNLRRTLDSVRGLSHGEPAAKAATSKAEREALSIVLNYVKRCWRSMTSATPSNTDIRSLLSLVEIRTFALDAGGADERTAKDLLRFGILANPSQADAAWDRLCKNCADLTGERSGGDAHRFQALLSGAGIQIRAVPSYREDIQSLRTQSRTTATLLRSTGELVSSGFRREFWRFLSVRIFGGGLSLWMGRCRSAIDRGVVRPAAKIRGLAFAPPSTLEYQNGRSVVLAR
jgi:hypothetical protein